MSQIHVFFCIPTSIAEAAAVVPNVVKTFFVKGTATFINGPTNLLNNDPKKYPDLIILLICALKSFISADVLLLKDFLALFFVSFLVIIHEEDYFH